MAKSKPDGKGARVEGPTLGEVVSATGLLQNIAATTRMIISRSVAEADAQGRVALRVVSCHDCTATKACCHLPVAIHLHEALPVAARLIAEGRDTPELRTQLRAAAEAMENTPRGRHQRPCVFLDADERCTVYTDRPSACGVALVYSPAEQCGKTAKVDAYVGHHQGQVNPQVEAGVRQTLGLPVNDRAYLGALPRMILLALKAWGRADYARFLAQHAANAAERRAATAAP